jgi:hypothetical protein
MNVAQILIVAANVLFVVALGTLGTRLLLMSRRTRRLPEFCLGLGFCTIVLGIPALAAAGFGRGSAGDIRVPLAALGLGLVWTSIVAQAAFTWRSFRPGSRWAAAAWAALTVGLTVNCVLCILSIRSADPTTSSFATTAPFILWVRIPLGIIYAWACTESLLSCRRARRRDVLGIGDPVVTNRFFLWFVVTAIACTNALVSTVLHLHGRSPTGDPVAAAVMGCGSGVCAVILYLVFTPPKSYVSWIAGTAEPASS